MSSAMKFIEGEENVIIFNLSQRSFEAYMWQCSLSVQSTV
jgi:hypothetical protein